MKIMFLPLLALTSCSFHHQQISYKCKLNQAAIKCIEIYIKNIKPDSAKCFISVSWVPFFGGQIIYVSKSSAHPNLASEYPVYWSQYDNHLVFVYNAFSNATSSDSTELKQTINSVIEKHNISLVKDTQYMAEDNITLRFIFRNNKMEKIDTSNVFVKICR